MWGSVMLCGEGKVEGRHRKIREARLGADPRQASQVRRFGSAFDSPPNRER